jgi:hypothetical protein
MLMIQASWEGGLRYIIGRFEELDIARNNG